MDEKPSSKTPSIEQVRRILGLDSPLHARPPEGERVDYKLDPPKDVARTVSAFANTSGGDIYLGVAEEQGIPTEILGCARGRTDLKTLLADLIRNMLAPPLPDYDIAVIPLSQDRDLAIVHVEQGDRAYQHTDGRVYVRVGDQTLPASVSKIVELESQRAEQLRELAERALPDIWIERRDADGKHARSPTYLKLWVTPVPELSVRLDNRVESRIGALIQRFFESPFEVKARRKSYTEWRRYSEPTDIDERIAVTADRSVCYTGQSIRQGKAPLVPLITAIQRYGLLAASVLHAARPPGRIQFSIELSTRTAPIVGQKDYERELFGIRVPAGEPIECVEATVFLPLVVEELMKPHALIAEGLFEQLRAERSADIDYEVFSKAIAGALDGS